MSNGSTLKALIASLLFTPAISVASTAYVTSDANDGPGSLREALASGADVIEIDESVGIIAVTESLQYTFTDALKVVGSGQMIDGSGLTDPSTPIFEVTMGADLAMFDLGFMGPGGYDYYNPGGGKGIFVDVPLERTGTVSLKLTGVSVYDVGNHGIHVSDCSEGDACGGGQGGGGEGSSASIDVRLVDVLVDGVGFGKQDADGVRVDDRADGDIFFSAVNSSFMNVGADGIELDEGNDGSVFVEVRNNVFYQNGAYCLPWEDDPQIDPTCNDDGDADVDDAFDVDEAGEGSIEGFVRNNYIIENYDEGLDFDEEDAGGYDLLLASNVAVGNEDEGVKISEENDGDIHATIRSHYSEDNNGSKEGIQIDEADDGTVAVVVTGSDFVGGDDEELKVEALDEGETGTVKVRGTDVVLDLDNVDEI